MSEYKTIPVVKRTQQYKQSLPSYSRPKKTATDAMQTKEMIQEKLKGYKEISPEELDYIPLNSHVRYITMDKETKKPLFRPGGLIVRVFPEYVKLQGSIPFSAQRYVYDKNGNRIFTTRFFKKKGAEEVKEECDKREAALLKRIHELESKVKKSHK